MNIHIWALKVLLCILFFLPQNAGAIILSDNLSEGTTDADLVNYEHWMTSSFGTDAASYRLESVTLLMWTVTGGEADVMIYTDNSNKPDALAGTMISPSVWGSSTSTFTSDDILLEANSTYWVVFSPWVGDFGWRWTQSDNGFGVGFQHTWGWSNDQGSTWNTFTSGPMQMQVVGQPIPEPTTMLLLGAGLAGLAAFRKKFNK